MKCIVIPIGASVKFADGGMERNKKDLGQIAMTLKMYMLVLLH